MEKVVVLTGAGMSAESGIATFRDANGLWENHSVQEVATPEGWRANPALVLAFYNQRRRQLFEVQPNQGHLDLVKLEKKFQVYVITQNVDDLHERAGSTNVIHLHGALRSARSSINPHLIYAWDTDITLDDKAEDGSPLRPNIVWFGEDVPEIYRASEIISDAHYVLVIGSSMQVYPAAGLVDYAPKDAKIWYIDPNPSMNHELKMRKGLSVLAENASTGVAKVVDELLSYSII
jgi:NAD-dependent deacetylase